jgi:hypothetical protein
MGLRAFGGVLGRVVSLSGTTFWPAATGNGQTPSD